MKRKLNKTEIKNRDSLLSKIEDAAAQLSEAVSAFETFRCDVVDEIESSYEDASEKWQESERGEYYAVWLEFWGTEFDGMEVTDCESASAFVETYTDEPHAD